MKNIFFIILINISIFYNTFSQVPPYVASAGLVAWYPFNNNANDASGTGNNGTVSGATSTTDRFGIANAAYSFDGINNYIEVLNSASLNFGNGTYNIWFSTTNLSNMQVIKKGNYNGSGEQISIGIPASTHSIYLHVKYNSNCAHYTGWNTQWTTLNVVNTVGEIQNWHMFTGVFNTDSNIVYVDAVKISAKAALNPLADNCTGNIQLAKNEAISPIWYQGKLDDFGIWNRPLTYQEIVTLYNGAPQSSLDIEKNNYFSVFPNPTSDIINIEFKTPTNNNHYYITDKIGKIVIEGNTNKKGEKINIANLSKGIYFLTIEKGNNYSFKIIKN